MWDHTLNTTETKVEIERPESSGRWVFSVEPVYPPGHPKASIERSSQGSPGTYKVTFVFNRPATPRFCSDLDCPRLMAAGDSLLEAGKDITILKVDLFSDPAHTQKFAEIIYRTNDANRLSVAEIQVQAPSFEEAERRAHLVVLPIISWWSLRYDIAIDISGYEVLEAATEVRRWVFNIEGGFRKFILDKADMQIQSDPHLRPIFSVYREGLNATHPFYQCLSFYKVTEAIKRLRAERRAAAKAAGKPIDEPPEKIPDTEESLPFSQKSIRRNFQPYLGRKYSWY